MNEPPWIEVAAGLLFRDGRLLLAQRPEGAHLAGLWEFPGGKRADGETFPECLRRELHEELGITVVVEDCVFEEAHTYPERRVRLRFFRCRLLAGEPRGLEGQAIAWVRREELGAYRFPPADELLVHRLASAPAWWHDASPSSEAGG
ncbi:MAG: 8-oxo-dGTP diphosphatase MutT [Verrucomicrobiales bacterium]|nr:8-oxo-dGTP diphosphatase MutT [Verrucomicrobiales bacterium]MCP5526184.1 8-oxo-dGTP diphosphatase MutT [Verrucomicrobiales bacterium]